MTRWADGICFIAEAGVNHQGDVELALEMVREAAGAGADAVKFQTFRAEALATRRAPKAAYQQRRDGARTQFEMLRALELDEAAHEAIARVASDEAIEFLSTPYDRESVDLLLRVGVSRLKLASGELTHTALLAHAAQTKKPLIMSTGMASLAEVDAAVAVLRSAECHDLTLLHCTSAYPAPIHSANVRAIPMLAARYGVEVGYSDHTEGLAASGAAIALGARVIERHFTLDRCLPGPDHRASLEPVGLAAAVTHARDVALALGTGAKEPSRVEAEARGLARRGLYALRHLEAGRVVRDEDFSALRPAHGVPASAMPEARGRRLLRRLEKGRPLGWGDLADRD